MLPSPVSPAARVSTNQEQKYRLFGGAARPRQTKALLLAARLRDELCRARTPSSCGGTYPDSILAARFIFADRCTAGASTRTINDSKHVVTWRTAQPPRFVYCRNENVFFSPVSMRRSFSSSHLRAYTLHAQAWQFSAVAQSCPIKFLRDDEKHGSPCSPPGPALRTPA